MAESWPHRTMRDILRILFTRWLSGLLIVALVVGLVWAATNRMARVYETQVTLVSPLTQAEQTLSGDIRSDTVWEVVLKTQHDILMGNTVLARTLARARNDKLTRPKDPPGQTSLEGSPALLLALRSLDVPPIGPDKVSPRPLSEKTRQAIVRAKAQADAIAAAASTVPLEDLTRLRKSIRMEVPGGQTLGKSQIFTIYVQAEDPEQAKKLADLLTEEFIFRYHELVVEMLTSRVVAAQNGLADLAGRYDPAEQAYAELVDRQESRADVAQLISLMRGPSVDVGRGRVQVTAEEDLAKLRIRLAGQEALAAAVKGTIDRLEADKGAGRDLGQIPIPEEISTANPAVLEWTRQLAVKVAQRIAMEQVYKSEYDKLVQLKAEIALLQDQLIGVLQAGLVNLQTGIARLKAETEAARVGGGGYLTPATQPETAPPKVGQTLVQLERLYSQFSNLQQLWKKQNEEFSQAWLAFSNAPLVQKIKQTDPAMLPDKDKPVRPVLWLNLMIAAVVGVLLALTYLFLADFYDHSVKSVDEVERYLGVPVLASVGKVSRQAIKS